MYGGAVIHGICRWRALVGVRIRRISRTVIMTPVPACICAGASVRGIVRGIIVLAVRYLYIYHIFFRFRMVNQAVFLLGKNGYFRICLIILLGNGHGITSTPSMISFATSSVVASLKYSYTVAVWFAFPVMDVL